jgi:hypothetical protein
MRMVQEEVRCPAAQPLAESALPTRATVASISGLLGQAENSDSKSEQQIWLRYLSFKMDKSILVDREGSRLAPSRI